MLNNLHLIKNKSLNKTKCLIASTSGFPEVGQVAPLGAMTDTYSGGHE